MSTWLITGANRGIGLELARIAVRAGKRVVVTAREPERARELEKLEARVEQLDVTDPASTRALAERLAPLALDVLVNNAGVMGRLEPIDRVDEDDAARTLATNAIGPLRTTRALLPHMRRGTERKIAHITSKMGSIDDNKSGGAYGYRMSKAALNMMNKSLAIDLEREGFKCVVLHPGWVRTAMGGDEAPLTAAESAAGLFARIESLHASQSGGFFDFRGEAIPW